jgi:hypothetical protein
MKSSRRGGVSATGLKAEMERRLREDPEYRREVERAAAERAERAQQIRAASQPVLDDLARIGIELDTLWDLYKVPEFRERAVPVLLRHLVLDYPEGVLAGIGDNLADKATRPWWAELKVLYLQPHRNVVRDRLACALSECAKREHYNDLLAFVDDTSLGESRIYFLRPINRIGNRIRPGQGRSVIESLAADHVLGPEAVAILKGRGPND